MNIGEKDPGHRGKTRGINLIFAGMAAAAFIAKLFGFLREIVIGANLGTTETADVYTQIFGIPALVFAAVGVAMSSLCIPVLTSRYSSEGTGAVMEPGRLGPVGSTAFEARENGKLPEAGIRFVSGLLQNVFIVTAAASFIFALLAYPASRLLLPGLRPGTDIFDTAVLLIKVMAPSLIFVCLTYISSGILQIHGRFIYTALISLPFNIAIIIALLAKGADIKLLGIVTTAGWAMQFLIQLPALYRERYRIVPAIRFGFGDPDIRNIYRQLPPIIIGNAMIHICIVTDRIFASSTEPGAAAALSYGSSLFMTITGIFTITMSTVVFPGIARYCSRNERWKVARLLTGAFRTLAFIFVPYLIIVSFFNRELIVLIYERGMFGPLSTGMVSEAFLLYSFCIAGYILQEITGRIFCAFGKYRIPMYLSTIFSAVNLALNLILYREYGIRGIAGSTAVVMTVYAAAALVLIKKETGDGRSGSIAGEKEATLPVKSFSAIMKLLIPGLAMTAAFAAYKISTSLASDNVPVFFSDKGFFVIPVVLGSLIYMGAAWVTGALGYAFKRQV